MEVITGIENVHRSFKSPVLTIGNFDGVHRGHQALFRKLKEWAAKFNGESLIMTFDPQPLEILMPGKAPFCITAHGRKLELISTFGIDVAIVIPFSKKFAQISARDFVVRILVEIIGIKAIVVGYDYRFGRGREGNIDFLRKMGEQYGFEVDTISGFRMDDTVVSSTTIRQLIRKGDLRSASRMLGRRYEITGLVVTGRKRGARLLGFPTANIPVSRQSSPKTGVYAVEAEVDGKSFGGAANLGYNPTFGDTELTLEVHLFDFNETIYGKPLTVRFVDRLRDEKRFGSIEELSAQIRMDIEKAKEILAAGVSASM